MSYPSPDSDDASDFLDDAPRRTMPPPELLDRAPPASVSQLVLSETRHEPPLLRRAGPRAELAHQFAQAAAAAQAGHREGEREALIAIARLLTSRARRTTLPSRRRSASATSTGAASTG